jgi:hypothetical protein
MFIHVTSKKYHMLIHMTKLRGARVEGDADDA